jgi:uncharacterized protein
MGMDTGKTAAIAFLDLSGNLVHVATQRYGGMEWFVDEASKFGTPVVIASDKKRAEGTITKLCAIFDAVLFAPREDISVKKKNELIENPRVTNAHERDALAAAVAAYNAYANKLHQAEKIARQENYEDIDRLKLMVIKKYSIDEVMERRKAGRRFVR